MSEVLFISRDPLGGAITVQCAHPLIGIVVSDPEGGDKTQPGCIAGIILEKTNRAALLDALRQIADGTMAGVSLDSDPIVVLALKDFAGNSLTVHSWGGRAGVVGLAVSGPGVPTACSFVLSDDLTKLIETLEPLADVEDLTEEEAFKAAGGGL